MGRAAGGGSAGDEDGSVILQSKYNPGDKVWAGHIETSQSQVVCHECLGSREWTVTTPAGNQITVHCPTCECGYYSPGTITKYAVVGSSRRLTIGTVRYEDSYRDGEGAVFKYMCEETGIGSGSVHRESELFDTEEEALAAGVAQAAEQQAHVAEQNAKTRAIREKKLARLKKCNVCEGSGRLSIQRNEGTR